MTESGSRPRRRPPAALALFAAACASPQPGSAPAPSPGEPPEARGAAGAAPRRAPELRRLETESGAYVVEYVPRPDPIPLNEPFELDVRVLSPEGDVVDDVELEVDARMPEHRHGMNRAARVERRPDRWFTARGLLLHMGGRWEVYLDVTRGGTTDRAWFELTF